MQSENFYDVLIVGAGAAGLAAAYELSLAGKKILVLEARDRIGGRIHSITDQKFAQVVETGAEFIHGKLPLTNQLLEKAGIKHHKVGGKMWQVKNGQLEKSQDFIKGWDKLIKGLKKLKEDLTIAAFLNQHFAEEKYKELRESTIRFVEGYDAADANKASSLALLEEWENEDDLQERVDNGYFQLMNFLATEAKKRGNEVYLSHPVQNINWRKNLVEITTENQYSFSAAKAIITIPLGVWQANDNNASIRFQPELLEKKEAAKKMGYGAVVKFCLQFDREFWQEDDIPQKMEKAGFIFSDAEIPTWWTQFPQETGLLTGWLAGPRAAAVKEETDESLLKKAIDTLSYIFQVDTAYIQKQLKAHSINNWAADPFARGAYSYATLDTAEAKKILSAPVEHTLYFAGEALYEGSETGTVEGALVSGTEVARQLIAVS